MSVSNTGIITARDRFVVSLDREALLQRIRAFADHDVAASRDDYGLRDVRERALDEAQAMVRAMRDPAQFVTKYLYHPFDVRQLFYHPSLVRWPVEEVMRHLRRPSSLGLVTTRQTRDDWGVLATRLMVAHKSLAAYDVNYVFPVYLEPEAGQDGEVVPNFAPRFLEAIASAAGQEQSAEDTFAYVYGALHSPNYRSRYAQFLKTDFPRIPLTSDRELFRELCRLGARLVTLHLMEADDLAPITTYPVSGDNRVEKVRYAEPGQGAEQGRVWINATQHFEGVPPEVWEFHVGGYQVCAKWLKDRKGRKLSPWEDLTHYQYVVAALAETIALMREIDAAIEAHGGWPLS